LPLTCPDDTAGQPCNAPTARPRWLMASFAASRAFSRSMCFRLSREASRPCPADRQAQCGYLAIKTISQSIARPNGPE
jgi:hypothetical protein